MSVFIQSLPVAVRFQTRAALSKAMEDTGVADPHSLDKSYWIQRVGEVFGS